MQKYEELLNQANKWIGFSRVCAGILFIIDGLNHRVSRREWGSRFSGCHAQIGSVLCMQSEQARAPLWLGVPNSIKNSICPLDSIFSIQKASPKRCFSNCNYLFWCCFHQSRYFSLASTIWLGASERSSIICFFHHNTYTEVAIQRVFYFIRNNYSHFLPPPSFYTTPIFTPRQSFMRWLLSE